MNQSFYQLLPDLLLGAAGRLVVPLDELRTLNEHAARTAGRVENPALEWFQVLDNEAGDGLGVKYSLTALAFLRREGGEGVLVDEAESVAFQLGRKRCKEPLDQGQAFQLLVTTRQDALEVIGVLMHGLDCLISSRHLFQDHGVSGVKAERSGLTKCLDSLREGDTLVVAKLDRLGRSLGNLVQLFQELDHLIEKAEGYRLLLDRYGVGCEEIRSDDPGRIIYEDEFQIVVAPHEVKRTVH